VTPASAIAQCIAYGTPIYLLRQAMERGQAQGYLTRSPRRWSHAMTDDHIGSRLAVLLRTLTPKTKQPVSTKVLNTWIAQAEGKLGE